MLGKRKMAADKTEVGTKRLKSECPYLWQIKREVLDFDHEKVCSVSMQRDINVYCCLTCGSYLRGKGPQTEAFTHSLDQEGHNIFINLQSSKIFCLPDNYEVVDRSLEDI